MNKVIGTKAMLALLAVCFVAPLAHADNKQFSKSGPISITCNGIGVSPSTGRQAIAGILTFAFEFDQMAQTMVLTQGGRTREDLISVAITDTLATGSNGKWLYEINRIDGTATIRSDLSRATDKTELAGNYFRGNCATSGAAKF